MGLNDWIIRRKDKAEQIDLIALYGGTDTFLSLKIHHGGTFTNIPGRKYVNGHVDHVDFVDLDLLSLHELQAMMEELWYVTGHKIFYHLKVHGLDLDIGLLPLQSDSDIHVLSNFVKDHKEISIFIEHKNTIISYYLTREEVGLEETRENSITDDVNVKRTKPNPDPCSHENSFDLNATQEDESSGNSQSNVPKIGTQVSVSEEVQGELFPMVDTQQQEEGSEDIIQEFLKELHGNEELHGDEEENKEDSDIMVDIENNIEDVEVDMQHFKCVVDDIVLPSTLQKKKEVVNDNDISVDDYLEVLDMDLFESYVSEEDRRRQMLEELKKPVVCSSGVVQDKFFDIGQSFLTKKDILEMVDLHSIETRRDLYNDKNDANRLRVKCRGKVPKMTGGTEGWTLNSKGEVGGCPWVLYASKSTKDDLWVVKTHIAKHTCWQTRKVKACSYKYLAKSIVQQVEENPTVPVSALHDQLERQLELGMSEMKVFRAKAEVQKQVHGEYARQYSLLRDYVMELKSCNEGSTVKIEVCSEPNYSNETRIFKRIYICLGSLKKGFRAGLRDLVGLDGAFMKGPYPGQVLSAVGLDSNNGIYPIAYAIVESECKNSWIWFLECLGDDLDLTERSNFTFISDRQKGIIPAITQVFPFAEHRFCLRHIHENMKLQWKSAELKDLVWNCATTTNTPVFEKAKLDLKKFNTKACDWLMSIPAKHWARSEFSGRALSDVLLNNMCEVFNSKISDGRDKPIISCLEYIRVYLMKRICIVQKAIDKAAGPLTPTATNIFEGIKKEAAQYRCIFGGSGKYQVSGPWMDQCVVNLTIKTCTCRYCALTGIPCKHAVAAIWDSIQNGEECGEPESWVHRCYWLSTWKDMYQYKVEPINGRAMWMKYDCPTTLVPPCHHTQVGRPKKKRKKGVDEEVKKAVASGNKLSRKFVSVKCGKCGNPCHNARTCKGQGGPTVAAQKGAKQNKGNQNKGKEKV